MDNIFKVIKNYQSSSDEGYYQFGDEKTISYHKSIPGAEAKIKQKLDEELAKYEIHKKRNSHITDKNYWDTLKEQINNNKVMIQEFDGSKNEMVELPLFKIEVIDLEN